MTGVVDPERKGRAAAGGTSSVMGLEMAGVLGVEGPRAGWEIHRGRVRWREESGGSARIERALVAATRGALWVRDLSAGFRKSKCGLHFTVCS